MITARVNNSRHHRQMLRNDHPYILDDCIAHEDNCCVMFSSQLMINIDIAEAKIFDFGRWVKGSHLRMTLFSLFR